MLEHTANLVNKQVNDPASYPHFDTIIELTDCNVRDKIQSG